MLIIQHIRAALETSQRHYGSTEEGNLLVVANREEFWDMVAPELGLKTIKKILPGEEKLEGGRAFWVEKNTWGVVEIFAGMHRGTKEGTERPWHSRDPCYSSTPTLILTGSIPFAHKWRWSPESQLPQVGRAALSGKADSLMPLEAVEDSPYEVPGSHSRRQSRGEGLSEDLGDSVNLRNGVVITKRRLWVGKWKIPRVNFRILLMSAHGTQLRDSQNNYSSHLRGNELPGVSLTVTKGRKMHCVLDKSSPLSQAYLL